MARFTRGFSGRGQAARDPRLPPGQYDAGRDWPVLTAEVTPRLSTDTWTFGVDGLVAHPTTWTWQQIHDLASSMYNGDIHCVTTWSKLGMTWTESPSTLCWRSRAPAGRHARHGDLTPATRRTSH